MGFGPVDAMVVMEELGRGIVMEPFAAVSLVAVSLLNAGNAPSAALWRATEEVGLPLIGVAEENGGSGGTLGDLLTVLQGAGRWTVPLPLAETRLAARLLRSAGTGRPDDRDPRRERTTAGR